MSRVGDRFLQAQRSSSTENMRILFLTYYFLPHVGGGTWFTFHVARQLGARGHSVQILAANVQYGMQSPSDQNLLRQPNVVFRRAPRWPLPKWLGPIIAVLAMAPQAYRMARQSDVVVIQFHPHHLLATVGSICARLADIPCVVRAEDHRRRLYGHHKVGVRARALWRLTWFPYALNTIAAREANAFLMVTPEARNEFVGRRSWRGFAARVHVVPNGVDPDLSAGLPSRSETRARLNLHKDEYVILFVGRLSGPEYGIETLLAAFEAVVSECPDMRLLLVGDRPTPAQQGFIETLRAREKVRVVGPQAQSEIPRYILAADLCVGPLLPTATIPLKVLEYAVFGRPILLGTGSVSPMFLKAYPNVILVQPNVQDVMTALASRPRTSVSADSTIPALFAWVHIVERLEKLLAEVAS